MTADSTIWNGPEKDALGEAAFYLRQAAADQRYEHRGTGSYWDEKAKRATDAGPAVLRAMRCVHPDTYRAAGSTICGYCGFNFATGMIDFEMSALAIAKWGDE